jgi:hypothetical protein
MQQPALQVGALGRAIEVNCGSRELCGGVLHAAARGQGVPGTSASHVLDTNAATWWAPCAQRLPRMWQCPLDNMCCWLVPAAGILIEDQIAPKSCGHVRGKKVVSREEAVSRIRAAVDAR